MEIIIILLLTLINGIFSMSEIALVSSRKFKLEHQAKKGSKGALQALALSESPNRFLSTVQIGITLVGIMLGIYSGENITNDARAIIEQVTWLKPYSNTLAIISVLLPVTYLSIVLGELLPKRIGLTYPETIAALVARPMRFISAITAPFVWLLTRTNDFLLRILGIRADLGSIVTEEEIKSIIRDSTRSGEVQKIEQDIVERVFAMGDRKVSALITHRSDLIWFDLNDDLATIRRKAGKELHSTYPVADGELDRVQGIVYIRDLFLHESDKAFSLKTHLRQPIYVPIGASAYKLLENFRQQKIHYALALDEYGSVQGMITMDDILDALVGDSSEAAHEEYQIEQVADDQWIMDGQYPFFEFVRYFNLDNVKDDNLEFNTVGGFLIHELHRMPDVGDELLWNNLTLRVSVMDNRRVTKIKVSKNTVEK
ncbi:MAG: HlyC/CorC family transporter [Lewinellaceae bacterium]|nr:HlyC/CorC family transporter [Lewinellaceae bacterium]